MKSGCTVTILALPPRCSRVAQVPDLAHPDRELARGSLDAHVDRRVAIRDLLLGVVGVQREMDGNSLFGERQHEPELGLLRHGLPLAVGQPLLSNEQVQVSVVSRLGVAG